MNAADINDPMVGTVLAEKYRLTKLIGRGGMGGVYEGLDLNLDRQVAIKLMNTSIAADKVAITRFGREAKAIAKLDHPNIITIHDFGTVDKLGAYLVMEFINGKSLRSVLRRCGALSLNQALAYFEPICAAVDAAHRRGIIHRDLKPENVMLKETTEAPVIKVVDFGLAKNIMPITGFSTPLTRSGVVLGTLQYIAPELFDNAEADTSSDVYALGIMFYEMITGSVPYNGSFENIIAGHIQKSPPPASKIVANISPAIDEAIGLALKKRRAERIANASDFFAALKSAAETAPLLSLPSAAVELLSASKVEQTAAQLGDNATQFINSGTATGTADLEAPTRLIDKSSALPSAASISVPPTRDENEQNKQAANSILKTIPLTEQIGTQSSERLATKLIAVVAALVIVGGFLIGYFLFFTGSEPPQSTTSPAPATAPTDNPPQPADADTAPANEQDQSNTDQGESGGFKAEEENPNVKRPRKKVKDITDRKETN